MQTRLLLTVCAVLGLTACAEPMVVDEFAAEETADGDGKADGTGTYTYYQVTADMNRCAWPRCGGFWVARANRSTTRCFDGTYAERCYVAEMRWSNLGLTEATVDEINGTIHRDGQVLMRGTLGGKTYEGDLGRLGEFKPTEAWIGRGPHAPTGPLAIVEEIGVRCITTPCDTFREKKLNSSATAAIAELGWDAAEVADEDISRAITELFVRDLIVAGDRYTVRGATSSGKARTVTQFYTRARDRRACYVGGCAGQLCSDREGTVSTCEYRPEYACYQSAVCEEQPEGECGWTETAALTACLADPAQR
ncbi:MAG: DUF6748 domain-containing protein [Kofleriaceae bacterium]